MWVGVVGRLGVVGRGWRLTVVEPWERWSGVHCSLAAGSWELGAGTSVRSREPRPGVPSAEIMAGRPPREAHAQHPLFRITAGCPLRGAQACVHSATPRPRARSEKPELSAHSGRPPPGTHSTKPQLNALSARPGAQHHSAKPRPGALVWKPKPGVHSAGSRLGIYRGSPTPGHSAKLQLGTSVKPGLSAAPRSCGPALSPGSPGPASTSRNRSRAPSPRGLGQCPLRGPGHASTAGNPQMGPPLRNDGQRPLQPATHGTARSGRTGTQGADGGPSRCATNAWKRR